MLFHSVKARLLLFQDRMDHTKKQVQWHQQPMCPSKEYNVPTLLYFCQPSKCCYLPTLSMPIRCECQCRTGRHYMYWLKGSSIYYFLKCPTPMPAVQCHFPGSLNLHHLLLRPEG